MSILIKGAKMPKGCAECPCILEEWMCGAKGLYVHNELINPFNERPNWCPLVEIPPHGELIDRDKLKNDIPETDADCFENCRDCTLLHQEDVWDIIDDASTVIESEEQEHE